MSRRTSLFTSAGFAVLATAVFALAACNKPSGAPANSAANAAAANAPTTDQGTNTAEAPQAGAPSGALPPDPSKPPSSVPPAPAESALPAAAPAAVSAAPPQSQYAALDDVAAMGAAFGDTPPDYAVDYGGSRPWIWRAANGAYRVVEAVPGGNRIFYYRAGSAEPFFIEDPSYGYAFDHGALAVVYDGHGRALAPETVAKQAAAAGRYLVRAQALYAAAHSQAREAAYLANWQARRGKLLDRENAWRQQQAKDTGWAAYHQAHAAQQQATWSQEEAMRQAYAARLATMKVETASINTDKAAEHAQKAADQAHNAAETAARSARQARVDARRAREDERRQGQ